MTHTPAATSESFWPRSTLWRHSRWVTKVSCIVGMTVQSVCVEDLLPQFYFWISILNLMKVASCCLSSLCSAHGHTCTSNSMQMNIEIIILKNTHTLLYSILYWIGQEGVHAGHLGGICWSTYRAWRNMCYCL